MRNKALINLLQPNYSPFFFDQAYEDEARGNFLREFHENEVAYFTSIDIPGVASEDIHIDVEDDYIRVTAERKDEFNKNSTTTTTTRKYDHLISIPKNVNKEKISAHYENGVLNLALEKIAENKMKKKISVSTGEKSKKWSDFLNFKKDEAGKVEGTEKNFN